MPSPDQYTFDPGFDYTATFGGFASALTQGLQLATPNSQHGIVAYMNTQPLTTGSPTGEYPPNWYTFNQRGLWVKPSTGETYSYKTGVGFTNVASLIPANTITNAMVKDSVVGLEKIAVPPGTTAGFVPTVNAGGNALAYSDPVNGRVDGSITVAKLAAGSNNQFLRTIGGIVQWDTFDGTDINALLSVTRLVPTYIQPGGPKQIMATDPTANFSNWYNFADLIDDNTIPVAKLSADTATNGQSIRRNTSNNGWEFYTPSGASPVATKWQSALLTVTNQTVAHTPTITTLPLIWQAVAICTDAGGDAGYALNQSIDVKSVVADISSGNSEETPYITIEADATNFKVILTATPNQIYVTNGTTYAAKATWDPAKWRIQINAFA